MNTTLSQRDVEKVQIILMQQLQVTREQITPESKITDDLGADSLDVMEIIMQVEDQFHVTIPDEVVDATRSVEELCDVLASMLEKSQTP